MEESNKMFRKRLSKKCIFPEECKYISYNFKKVANLGKLCFLPKIYKRLYSVPSHPVIPNCGTSAEKLSKYLDYHVKPIMLSAKSYIKDTGDFFDKLKELGGVPQNALLVTVDAVGLYPSIPHQDRLDVFSIKLEQ